MKRMSELSLQRWVREFRRDADADRLAIMRNHLRGLGLRDKPEKLLEGTIEVVQACTIYLRIDGQSADQFLAMQSYDPDRSAGGKYTFTFDIFERAFARVLVSPGTHHLDLADVYGHPWLKYKRCGYGYFWITRTDSAPLKKRELAELEREMTKDLRFDYSEDELDFWFDDAHTPGALFVNVQDHLPELEE